MEPEARLDGSGMYPALETKISIPPNVFAASLKAFLMAFSSTMSATRERTLRFGNSASRDDAVEVRVGKVRPRSTICVEPDEAKECAMVGPRPDPPPVIRMVCPAVLRWWRRGEMEA